MRAKALSAGLVLLVVLRAPAAGPPCPPTEKPTLVQVVYQVADLVISGSNKTEEDQLIKLICSTVQPRSWIEWGGPGTIDYSPPTQVLVVNQTPEVHEQIADVLASLRGLTEIEFTVEFRFLSVSGECLDKLGLANKTVRRLLDDAQLRKFLEAAQTDLTSMIAETPRFTLVNCGKAIFDFKEMRWAIPAPEYTFMGTVARTMRRNAPDSSLQVSVLPVISVAQAEETPLPNNAFVTRYVPPKPATITLQLAVGLSPKDEPDLATTSIWSMKVMGGVAGKPVVKSNWNLEEGVTVLLSGWTPDEQLEWLIGPPGLNRRGVKEGKRLVLLLTVRRNQEKPERITGFRRPSAEASPP